MATGISNRAKTFLLHVITLQVSLEKRWETKLAVMFAAERWPPSAVSSWAVRDFLAMSTPLGRSEMGDTQVSTRIFYHGHMKI